MQSVSHTHRTLICIFSSVLAMAIQYINNILVFFFSLRKRFKNNFDSIGSFFPFISEHCVSVVMADSNKWVIDF